MKNKTYILFFILLNLFFTVKVFAEQAKSSKKRIAMLSISAHNTSKSAARVIRNNLEIYLFKTNKYEILEREQIDFVLKEKNIKYKDSNKKNDAAKIGELVSADYVIIGSIDKFDKYTITIKVVEVSKNKIVVTENMSIDSLKNLKETANQVAANVDKKLTDLGSIKDKFNYYDSSFYFLADYSILTPVGSFKDSVKSGYGFSLSGGVNSFLIKNLSLGVKTGLFNFKGDDKLTESARMLPILGQISYNYYLWRFSLVPEVLIGTSYNSNSYYKYTSGNETYTNSSFQFMTGVGIGLSYYISDYLFIKLNATSYHIHEQGNTVKFYSSGVGFGLQF